MSKIEDGTCYLEINRYNIYTGKRTICFIDYNDNRTAIEACSELLQ